MTELETAIAMIKDVFDRYCYVEGKANTLTKGEMKTMMEKELPGIMETAKNKDEGEKLLKDLEENGESEVDFSEFLVLVAAIITVGNDK